MPAPIALFVYNRPEHTRKTVESLAKNDLSTQSDLFVFADGPREHDDLGNIRQVREYIRSIRGFKSIHFHEKEKNAGLARSIIEGVTRVTSEAGRVIVVEDDMVCSPFFLKYMNDALELYESDPRVCCIHGYVFPTGERLPETFMLRGGECWGWAAWKRSWDLFEPDGVKLLRRITERGLQREFDLQGSFPYTQMLKDQTLNKNNSWAIRWRASTFLLGGLTLWPGTSLVRNIGHDHTGTHCGASDCFDVDLASRPVVVGGIPVLESAEAREVFARFFRSLKKSLLKRVVRKAVTLWKRFFPNVSFFHS